LGDASIALTANEPVMVNADAGQLRQVVWNLLRNASEAAPDLPIRVSVSRDQQRARLVIADEGPGISDEHLSRIFEPFFSTKEGGTGLGLPTVHRIVEEHHGRIELSRNPSGGTSAVLTLPLRTI
jgi:two-component system sensor histidine kinase PilS (NtrC family)